MPGSARGIFLSHVTSAVLLSQNNVASAENGAYNPDKNVTSTISSSISDMRNFAQTSNLTGSELLIGAAVASVAVLLAGGGYLIASRMSSEEKLEKIFEDELKHKVTIYFLRDRVKKPSWDIFLDAFITEVKGNNLRNDNSFLYPFSGIEPSIVTKNNETGVLYSVQLYSSMAVHFEPFAGDGTLLDSARRRIERLLKSESLRIRDLIGQSLTDSILQNGDGLVKYTMLFQPERNLDWLRASLFLVNALSNMAINLCEPSDPKTNDALGLEESFHLCAKLVRIIDFMLSPEVGSPLSIATLCRADLLRSFLEELKINILELQKGYEIKLLNQVNLSQIITGTYTILKKIHIPISQLLYPNESKSHPERFIQKLDYMLGLINQYPKIGSTLVRSFNNVRYREKQLFCKPKTLIDIIALFCSQKNKNRLAAIADLRKNKDTMWKVGFSEILEYFNKNFIQPLEKNYNEKDYFIYWIALILESYHVNISYRQENQLQVKKMNDKIMRGMLKNDNFYGQWSILTLVKLRPELKLALRNVLKAQYSLIPVIRSLNLMDELLDKYKNFLLNKSVQFLLKRCILALEERAEILLQSMRDMNHSAHSGRDDISNTQLRYSLAGIIDDQFQPQVLALQEYIFESLRVINSPKFIQEEEAEVTLLLNNIVESARIFSTEEEYRDFFNEICQDSGMLSVDDSEEQEVLLRSFDIKPADVDSLGTDDLIDESIQLSYVFQIQALSSLTCGISIGLLVVGIMVILSMTLGAHYLPMIAAMSASATSIVIISGFMSSAVGCLGFTASYFTPKFFKESPNPERFGDFDLKNQYPLII